MTTRILSLLVFIQVLVIGTGYSQNNTYKVVGTVQDASSNMPIEYATILIEDSNSGATLGGETTDAEGKFAISIPSENIGLEISFIGYQSKKIEAVSFNGKNADLGVIVLAEDSQTLDEVVVRADKSTTEFKLDKRVFNVGQDLSSTGASALEVLNNVPSVNVNIEGAVTLRGSGGVQILINGKPSILANEQGNALGTITADMIEKVEVITNPSAKYEAEGSSGIINIVLKKEDKKGLNGSVSVNTGIPHNHSVGLSINNRSEKFNVFSQVGAGYRELPSDVEVVNINRATGAEVRTMGEEFRNEKFYNFNLGTDYYINSLNVVTLSGSFAFEDEQQPSSTQLQRLDGSENITSQWTRTEVTEASNPKLQYELQYKKDFADSKDHNLLFSAIGRFFGKEQSSYFTNEVKLGNMDFDDQETETEFKEGKYTFNLDYTKPFSDKWTLETGAQYLLNDVSNDFSVSDLINGEWKTNPGLTNTFEYNQKVLGVYGTGAYEGDLWGLKLGLRVENTDLKTLLLNTQEDNSQNFTNLFPSVHTSYKLSESISFQIGYSRRIYRPRLWDLNPFFNIRNNFSIRQGNPRLQPEFTDSYEIGSIFIFEMVSFNFNVYQRNVTEKIEYVSTFEGNVNTRFPMNIGTKNSTGLELNFKYPLSKKITLNGDMNYNVFTRKGRFSDTNFDFSADQWSTKLNTKFKMNRQLDFELTGRYQSRERSVQGETADNLFADFGLRYKILKGRWVVSLGVRDIFASRVRESFAEQDSFYNYSRRQRGRFISLGFSYGFGKGEAMQYSGRRR